jgi:TP901 family phage tail tape measure protein
MASNTTFIDAVFRAIDRVTAPVNRMQQRIGRFTRAAQRNLERVGRVSDKIAAGIKKGFMAAAVAVAAFGAAAKKVIEVGAEFEQTIVSAAVKFPGEIRQGSEAFKELEDAARKTGASTEFSANQSAQALNFLAMAGFTAEQAIAALPGVVDLATASGVELQEATDMASDSLGAFGMMADDTATLTANLARVNDVLAKTTTSANTTMEDMFEAIKEGATTATKAGADIETFSAHVAAMANAGIKGSKAGTTLKGVFLNLQAPARAGKKAIREIFGKKGVLDEHGKLRDTVKIFGELKEKLSGLGQAKQAQLLKDIFGKIALPGALVLLEQGTEKLDKFRDSLYGAGGTAAEMAAVMRDTTMGAIKSLMSAVEGVVISLFKLESTGLKNTIEKMTEWVRVNEKLIVSKVGEWLRMIIDNFGSIVKWAKRIAKGIAIFWAFHTALKAIIGVMWAVNIAMSANPIGLLIIGVSALIVGFASLIYWSEEVVAWFDKMNKTSGLLIRIFAPLVIWIKRIAQAATFIKKNWDPAMKTLKVAAEFIKILFEPIGKFFDNLWDGIVDSLDGAVTRIKEILDPLGSWIKETFQPVSDFINDTITNPVMEFFGENVANPLEKLFDETLGGAWNQATRNIAKAEGAALPALPSDMSDAQYDYLGDDFRQTQMVTPQQRQVAESNSTSVERSESNLKISLAEGLKGEGKMMGGISLKQAIADASAATGDF